MAAIYSGAPRNEAARIGDVTVQIVQDWVEKPNTHGPDGLLDRTTVFERYASLGPRAED